MLNKKIIFTVLFWGLVATITFLLLLEVNPTPQTWPKDKLLHAVAFTLLAYLGTNAYLKHALYIFFTLAIYGGLMELAQSQLTQTRTGSIGDWLADVAGIMLIFYALTLSRKSVPV